MLVSFVRSVRLQPGLGSLGRDIVVRAGELLQIPPNLPHAAEAVEDTLAIDVFSPVRQDWVDKTDTYFRR